MNRPQSRWEIRKSALRAFERRNRLLGQVRQPEQGETGLSPDEAHLAREHEIQPVGLVPDIVERIRA
jgi:hypothetical protein